MSAAGFSRARVEKMFAAIDENDSESFASYLADDATFRFGSAPAVSGRDAIVAGVGAFFETIGGCRHALGNTLAERDTLVCEGEVTYTRLDDSTCTLPFVDVFEIDGRLIRDYKIYIDISPLYQT